jgi:5-formyltetrahydrofolate cyclo-ligase
MSGSVAEEKTALRHRLREAIRRLSPREWVEGSRRICDRLRNLPVMQESRSILFYRPMPEEPDVWPLALEALGQGREVGLLRYSAAQRLYVPCVIRRGREETDVVMGPFGVGEPGPDCPAMDAKRLDLVLVPGIGFSVDGARLGRGKGFYDRVLSGISGFRCGVAFDCQVVAALPVEPHDIYLNGILTPSGWHSVPQPARS